MRKKKGVCARTCRYVSGAGKAETCEGGGVYKGMCVRELEFVLLCVGMYLCKVRMKEGGGAKRGQAAAAVRMQ